MLGHRADRRRDRHVVVVEDHDQPLAEMAGIVHCLIGHARRKRAVADDADDIARFALEVARYGKAEAGRNRCRRMRGAERVVFALRTLREAGKAAALSQRAYPVAPAGQDLVRIGLMADIEDQRVARRVEDGMDRHRQFHDAEAGAQMASGNRHRGNGLLAKFVSKANQLACREAFHVGGRRDPVQDARGRDCFMARLLCRQEPGTQRMRAISSPAHADRPIGGTLDSVKIALHMKVSMSIDF